jgi:hypothetical protein
VFEDRFDLVLGVLVDLEVGLGPQLGVPALQVLANHDERHQVDLDQVADE